MHHFSAHRAHPTQRHLSDQVGAANDANQPSLVKDRQALDALMHEEMADLLQVGIWRHADDPTSHHVTDALPLFPDDIALGHHPHHDIISAHDNPSATPL